MADDYAIKRTRGVKGKQQIVVTVTLLSLTDCQSVHSCDVFCSDDAPSSSLAAVIRMTQVNRGGNTQSVVRR